MPIEVRDEPPYFDRERFERPCPNPDCTERIVFHYAQVSRAPRSEGWTLSILSKCFDADCGYKDTYEPAIEKETHEALQERFDGETYIPWSDDHMDDPSGETARVYTDEEAEHIEEHLESLGYF